MLKKCSKDEKSEDPFLKIKNPTKIRVNKEKPSSAYSIPLRLNIKNRQSYRK
jgi:hypothetical protein